MPLILKQLIFCKRKPERREVEYPSPKDGALSREADSEIASACLGNSAQYLQLGVLTCKDSL